MNAAAERVARGMWWDRAWKLVEGCSPASPGCEHCWSARETHMRAGQSCEAIRTRCDGLTTAAGAWTGAIRLRADNLGLPASVKRPAVWAIWNDLFHEDVEAGFISTALGRMNWSRRHTFVVLTKRAEHMATMWARIWMEEEPSPNVVLGISAENQEWLDRRWEHFRNVRCAAKFIGYEPALGPIRLPGDFLAMGPRAWVACQGESGPGARPMHPDWARSVRDQCVSAGVPFFFKGWGEWMLLVSADEASMYPTRSMYEWPDGFRVVREGKRLAGRLLDGRTWDEFPEVG